MWEFSSRSSERRNPVEFVFVCFVLLFPVVCESPIRRTEVVELGSRTPLRSASLGELAQAPNKRSERIVSARTDRFCITISPRIPHSILVFPGPFLPRHDSLTRASANILAPEPAYPYPIEIICIRAFWRSTSSFASRRIRR